MYHQQGSFIEMYYLISRNHDSKCITSGTPFPKRWHLRSVCVMSREPTPVKFLSMLLL